MPCNSDHMHPTPDEAYRQRTAQLLLWLHAMLGINRSPKLAIDSDDIYCSVDYTGQLCALLQSLSKPQSNIIVYNGRSRNSRDLANWWEDHQANDARRTAAEKASAKKQALVDSAMSKLTPAERKALGL